MGCQKESCRAAVYKLHWSFKDLLIVVTPKNTLKINLLLECSETYLHIQYTVLLLLLLLLLKMCNQDYS